MDQNRCHACEAAIARCSRFEPQSGEIGQQIRVHIEKLTCSASSKDPDQSGRKHAHTTQKDEGQGSVDDAPAKDNNGVCKYCDRGPAPGERCPLRLQSRIAKRRTDYFVVHISTPMMDVLTIERPIVNASRSDEIGKRRLCRMAISLARQRLYAITLRMDANMQTLIEISVISNFDSCLLENCSSKTPPANIANAVRSQARNVRSLASVNL